MTRSETQLVPGVRKLPDARSMSINIATARRSAPGRCRGSAVSRLVRSATRTAYPGHAGLSCLLRDAHLRELLVGANAGVDDLH